MYHKFLSTALIFIFAVSANFLQTSNLTAKNKTSNNIGQPVEQRLGKPSCSLLPDKTVRLYPYGQNSNKGLKEAMGPLVSNGLSGAEVAGRNGFLGNVTDSARIDIYFPEKPNGQMVIICAGGSYFDLSSWYEGIYCAYWMKQRGITACVLKYRLPNGHPQVPLTDAQNAFKYCRAHSKEWGVDQIGIIGFSAGGHLASTAETMYTDTLTKPDFAILMYPVISMKDGITHAHTKSDLLGTNGSWMRRDGYTFEQWYSRQKEHSDLECKYSTFNDITPSTPPTFIALCTDDNKVSALNSMMFYQALVNNKVPTELHIFARGGHGWGFMTSEFGTDQIGYARNELSASLERWMREIHESGNGHLAVTSSSNSVGCDIQISKTVLLYPEGQNSDKGLDETKGPGESNGVTGVEKFDRHLYLSNIGDSARFDLFFPKKANGQMVVICPGGGYGMLSMVNEGTRAAEWLLDKGISVCLLKYRLPQGHWTVPLTDVQNAFRYCRTHSAEWGVKQIGVMGFSAGGHLAASASTLFTDDITRPDFSILCYPVITMEMKYTNDGTRYNLIGKDEVWSDTEKLNSLIYHYSLENQVSAKTSPTFIMLCSDDPTVPPENSIRFYEALLANNVTAEIHSYPRGYHGFGFNTAKYGNDKIDYCRNEMFMTLSRFLNDNAKKIK